MKIPHPHLKDQKESVYFPVLSSNNATFSDRAIFYKQVLDLQEQVKFDGNDGPMLYYTLSRCLRNESLSEWKDIVEDQGAVTNFTPENFSKDVDKFIRQNETRDNEELLQAQLNYMNHLTKPRSMKPSKFKNALIKLNRRITLIPDSKDSDKLDDVRLRSIYYSAMPVAWQKDFKKVGKKLSTESLNDLATYFDLYFEPESSAKPSSNSNSKSNSQSNQSTNTYRSSKGSNNNNNKNTSSNAKSNC